MLKLVMYLSIYLDKIKIKKRFKFGDSNTFQRC